MITVYSQHCLLEFVERYQYGILWQYTDVEVNGDTIRLEGVKISENPTWPPDEDAGPVRNPIFNIQWGIPESLRKSSVLLRGGPGAHSSNPTERIFTSLPTEYIKAIVSRTKSDLDQLVRNIENIQSGKLPFNMEVVSQPPNQQTREGNSEIASKDHNEFMAFSNRWPPKIRMARMLAFGMLWYSRKSENVETNLDESFLRVCHYLEGNDKPAPVKRIQSTQRAIESAVRTEAQQKGFTAKLKQVYPVCRYTLDDLLAYIDYFHVGDLYIGEADDHPDKTLFRAAVTAILEEPIMPISAGDQLKNIFSKAYNEVNSGKQDQRQQLTELSETLTAIQHNRVTVRDFIVERGSEFPTASAIFVYLLGDNLSSIERMKERLSANKVTDEVRWLAWIFYGIQNGYNAQLPISVRRKHCFNNVFRKTLTRLLNGETGQSDWNIDKDSQLRVSSKVNDDGRLEIRVILSELYKVKVTVTDPVISILRRMLRIAKSAQSDLSASRKLLDYADQLSLPSLPWFRDAFTLEVESKNRKASFQGCQGKFKFGKDWKVQWRKNDAGWSALLDNLENTDAMRQHVCDHQGAWENVLKHLTRGSK